jgi:hypothetical protein
MHSSREVATAAAGAVLGALAGFPASCLISLFALGRFALELHDPDELMVVRFIQFGRTAAAAGVGAVTGLLLAIRRQHLGDTNWENRLARPSAGRRLERHFWFAVLFFPIVAMATWVLSIVAAGGK